MTAPEDRLAAQACHRAAMDDGQDAHVAAASDVVDLQMQQIAYQASLGATATVIQPSLRDFLR